MMGRRIAAAAVAAMLSAQPAAALAGDALRALGEEMAIADLLLDLGAATAPGTVVLRDVSVVDPVDATVTGRQSVIVGHGTIFWVGATADEPAVPDAHVIDGRGLYVAPGLTDMHVHSESASSWLLNLACGVTTVREMGGFPWLLTARGNINDDRFPGPTLYVAGTIINYLPLEGYAVLPRDAVSARRVVRQQAACGYDFVKVHNVLPRRILEPVASMADLLDLDLVGHVPHGIAVREAVAYGMRTMEHLKGFLDDRTLEIGDTDYAAAVGPEIWVTPTLSAFRDGADRERAALVAPEAAFVPTRVRDEWARLTGLPEDDALRRNRHALELGGEIIRALSALKVQFLAGTDAGGYPFQVMGYALIDELGLLRQAGLTPLEIMRAATSAPAAAMRAAADFGRVRAGMRADLVLLEHDPLADPAAYARNEGVMVRGRWFERAPLDAALAALARIYAADATPTLDDEESADALVRRVVELQLRGFVFNDRILTEAATDLERGGHQAAAAALNNAVIAPSSGPCAAIAR